MTIPFRLFLATLLLLSLVGLCVHRADADTLELTWTHPTQNVDGSSVPSSGPGSIAATRLEWGSCSGTAFGTKAGEATVPFPATTYTIAGLAPGAWCFRAFSRNTYGEESGPSGVVSKAIAPPVPKPPVLVTVATTVYEAKIHPTMGLVAGRQVGTVPVGANCLGDESGLPYASPDLYRVLLSAVSLSKTPRSELLLARCEITG